MMEPYERMVKHTIRNVMGRSTKTGLLVYHIYNYIYNYIYTYIFMFNPTNEMMAHSAVEDHVGWGETSRCVLGPCHWLMFKPGYLGLGTHPNEWINTKDLFSNWLQITPQHDYSDVNRRVLGRHDLLTIVCQSMRIGAILTSI